MKFPDGFFFFFVADTGNSSNRQANGVCGYSCIHKCIDEFLPAEDEQNNHTKYVQQTVQQGLSTAFHWVPSTPSMGTQVDQQWYVNTLSQYPPPSLLQNMHT